MDHFSIISTTTVALSNNNNNDDNFSSTLDSVTKSENLSKISPGFKNKRKTKDETDRARNSKRPIRRPGPRLV